MKPNGLDWSNLLKLGDHIKQVAVDNNKDGSLSLFFIGLDNNMYYKYQLKPNGLDWSNLLKLENLNSADTNGPVMTTVNQSAITGLPWLS